MKKRIRFIILLARSLITSVAFIRLTGLDEYLRLRAWISGYGVWGHLSAWLRWQR